MELLLAGVRLSNKRIRMLLHLIGLSEKIKFRRSIGEGYLDFLQPKITHLGLRIFRDPLDIKARENLATCRVNVEQRCVLCRAHRSGLNYGAPAPKFFLSPHCLPIDAGSSERAQRSGRAIGPFHIDSPWSNCGGKSHFYFLGHSGS